MAFNLALAQCCHPEGDTYQDVLGLVDRWCADAAAAGADLLVFPESLMTRYERARGEFLEAAQPLDGPFCQGVEALAARHGLWLVYTANELNPGGGNPFNTAVLVDSAGGRRGVYRKAHLFDTDFTRESDRMAASDELFRPVETPFGVIGLSICYDLRFPEAARVAALQGCQVFINASAWVDGRLKGDQWKTLLSARAIENEMFVAGVCRVDKHCAGQSCIFGPDGALLAGGGQRERLVMARIDLEELRHVRATIPVFQHRKPQLYGLVAEVGAVPE